MGIKVFFSSIIFLKHHNFLTKNCIPVPFCWSFVCWANSLFSFSDFLFCQINFFLKILNFFKFLNFFKWMLTQKKILSKNMGSVSLYVFWQRGVDSSVYFWSLFNRSFLFFLPPSPVYFIRQKYRHG